VTDAFVPWAKQGSSYSVLAWTNTSHDSGQKCNTERLPQARKDLSPATRDKSKSRIEGCRGEGRGLRARVAVVLLSAFLLFLGFALVVLPSWNGLSLSDWGYTMFSLGADIALVYLLIDVLVLRNERETWRAVETETMMLIRADLLGLLLHVAALVGAIRPRDPDSTAESMLAEMRLLSHEENRDELRKRMDEWLFGALPEDSDRDPTFAMSVASTITDYPRRLGNLPLRCPRKFLDPALVALMIELENDLEELNKDILIAGKVGLNRFAQIYRTVAVSVMRRLLETLVNGVDKGMVPLPPFGETKAPTPVTEEDKKCMKQCSKCGTWSPLASEKCSSCHGKQFKGYKAQ
jgi:hypothetical protein